MGVWDEQGERGWREGRVGRGWIERGSAGREAGRKEGVGVVGSLPDVD
jgi:hypothetical protein